MSMKLLKDSVVIQDDFKGVEINGELSSKNVADYFQFNFGDVDKGFKDSDYVIEKDYYNAYGTPRLY